MVRGHEPLSDALAEVQSNSLSELRHQVNRCTTSLEEPWPDDQIDDVVAYLNRNFYKFGE